MLRSRVALACLAALPWVFRMAHSATAEEPRPRCLSSDGRAGVRAYVPGAWGMLAVDVANPTDHPVEVLSSAHFGGHPDLQYARPLWVPARARIAAWQPVLVPAGIPAQEGTAQLKSFLMLGPGREVLRTPAGEMAHNGLIALRHDRSIMGILADAEDADAEDAPKAMRIAAGLDSSIADLNDRRLPVSAEFLEGISHLVIASDRLAADAAAWIAVRRWLHGGGRVWVMLDRVDPAIVSLLLGDAFRCHVVDRVGLTRVEVRRAGPEGDEPAGPRRALEEPVDLVRVTAGDFRITHTVNGWPAAFRRRVGQGELLVTTLGARGWIRARTPADPRPRDSTDAAFPVAAAALGDLTRDFCARREPAADTEALGEFVSGQIGYEVVSRSIVIAVLGGFCAALGLCGVWLSRIGRLERLGWIGPGLAVLAACLLGWAGRSSRTAAPVSVALAQLAEADPDVDELRVTGWMALYQPEASKRRLGAERGGVFAIDMDGLSGSTRRMVWTDLDRWHWENLSLPSGVRAAPLRWATTTAGPIRARATFGPEGLTGTVESGPLGRLDDAILTTGWSRDLAVRLADGDRFAAGAGDALAPGQFTQGVIVDQRQQWTQSMVRRLLEDPAARRRFQAAPALLARTAPIATHLGFLDDVERSGGAIATIPLELERPVRNSRVVIPSLFLPFRAVNSADGTGPSTAFSNLDGTWLGPLVAATRVALRFQCPPQVLPLRCESATLTVALRAPSRTLTILGTEDGKPVSLARIDSPIGVRQFTIDRAGALKLDRGGGLLLEIAVSEMQAGTGAEITTRGWKIDEVQLELSGQTGSE